MNREGAAHALLRYRSAHDGVVGRVVNGVGDARDHHQSNQCGVDREHADENEGYRLQRHAGDENAARAVPIHEKSHRRLYESRGQAERREGKAELGETDTIDIAQHRKQRRQQQ